MLRANLWQWSLVLAVGALLLVPAAQLHANEGSGSDLGVDDMFGRFADVSIWTIVVFVVLLLVLGKFAWKPMLEGLEKREKAIHDALDEARKAREEAERLRAAHQLEMNKAQDQVRAILDEGRRNAQQAADDLLNRARAESQAERDRVRREMEVAKDQALQQLTGWAAQLATMISAKTLHRNITLDDHRRLVDEALADMKQTGAELQRQSR
jgi:F-type H+-transporting ATPase subunit b